MAIFAIVCDDDRAPEPLDQAVKTAFPERHFRFSSRCWFISAGGMTAKQAAERLGVKKGGMTGVVALQMTGSYWGVANPALWEWLKTSFERADG